jgi:hypothetical protein
MFNGLQSGHDAVAGNLLKYYAHGVSVLPHFNQAGGVSSIVTNGSATGIGSEQMYAIGAANKHYVFSNAFAAAGGNAANVKVMYGGAQMIPTFNRYNVASSITYDLPQQYVTIAPYFDTSSTSGSFFTASLPAGYAGASNPGNWPADAWNDLEGHYLFYGTKYTNIAAGLKNDLAGTPFQVIGYEGGVQNIYNGGPFWSQRNQDAFFHPSFRNNCSRFFAALQTGHPNVANSGFSYFSWFSYFLGSSNGPIWKIADGPHQNKGLGASNQFMTPSGGAPGSGNPWGYNQTNQSPGLQAMADWNGTQTPTHSNVSTTQKRRWFPGLRRPLMRIEL